MGGINCLILVFLVKFVSFFLFLAWNEQAFISETGAMPKSKSVPFLGMAVST